MQINLKEFSVNALDKAYINIGPSIQTVIRAKANQNYGLGEVVGDDCEIIEAFYQVQDNDVIDFLHHKTVIYK